MFTHINQDVKKKLTDDLLVRWTSDYETKADQSDANVFMKYLYLEYKPSVPFASALTAGIVSAPYIGYYEDIWPYRMRDKIHQERLQGKLRGKLRDTSHIS